MIKEYAMISWFNNARKPNEQGKVWPREIYGFVPNKGYE